jgi:alpha-beta hydrolase superfamily lysophospholipase
LSIHPTHAYLPLILSSSSGMALNTSILTPKDQEPKAVLLFCHGFGDNASFMKRYNFFKYVKEGIAVVTIEYEGHEIYF